MIWRCKKRSKSKVREAAFRHFAMMATAGGNSTTCNFQDDEHVNFSVDNFPTIYVHIVLFPILLSVCTVGNLLTIIVLSREPRRSTTNIYLICVAISDLAVLWLQLPDFLRMLPQPVVLREKSVYPFRIWMQHTAIRFSDWTLVVFSIERLLAISNPLQFQRFRTAKVTILTELLVLLLSGISNMEILVKNYYYLMHGDGHKPWVEVLPVSLISWHAFHGQAQIGIVIITWILLVFTSLALLRKLTSQTKTRNDTLHGNSNLTSGCRKIKETHRSSHYVLLGCVVLYFVTQLPFNVYRGLHIASEPPYCYLTNKTKLMLRPVMSLCLLSNYSLNFLVYCVVSRRFRNQLSLIFATSKTRKLLKQKNAFTSRISNIDSEKVPTEVPVAITLKSHTPRNRFRLHNRPLSYQTFLCCSQSTFV